MGDVTKFGATRSGKGDSDAIDARRSSLVAGEQGAIGYVLAWLMGVPAGLLFIIFLARGCN